MRIPLDADEAVEGIAAFRILHGHFVLMESNARYLGALDSYVLAPFIALFGPTLLAIRIGLSLVGAGYVAASYALGRFLLGRRFGGLLLAAIAAVFPLFALTYGIKARTYGLLLLLEVICLIFGLRLAWLAGPSKRWEWAVFGLLAGISVWHDVLLVIPLLACTVALLLRGGVVGWPQLGRGLLTTGAAALLGFSPWLLYNAQTRLGSLRHLYTPLTTYSIPTGQAVRQALDAALPIFVGARVNFCGAPTVPPLLVDAVLGLLAIAVLWLRRRSLNAIVRGHFREIEAVDAILLIAPLALIAVTVRWFNALSCEPRYLMPLAVPLVLGLALMIRATRPLRIAGVMALVGFLLVSGITFANSIEMLRGLVNVPGAPPAHVDLPAAATALERESPQAIWAQYWLARPIEFISGDRLLVGEYGGYVGFPDTQRAVLATARASWLFVAGDPEIASFTTACASRGITYQETTPVAGLTFFTDLSGRLMPSDLGIQTQTPAQAD